MQLKEILSPDRVVSQAQTTSKKRALELMSHLLSGGENAVEQEVFEGLCSRERLGTTALGHGVALPHGRMKNVQRAIGAFAQLSNGVDFDAADRQRVDLLFAIAVPEQSTEEHLQLVAQIAELFSDETMRQRLRQAKNADDVYQVLSQWSPQHTP